MNKIILTIGASASGKSSWTEEYIRNRDDWVNLNRDDIRFSLFNNGDRDWTKYKFKSSNEKRVTEVQDEKAKWARFNDKNIIVSDTNLNPKTRTKWKQWAEQHGYQYEEKLFPCKWETLVKRNAQRYGGLSESLLWDQYVRYERQFGDIEVYQHEEGLPYCVICDIDGTIASMEGRSPFDWSKVVEDKLRVEISKIVFGLSFDYNHTVFLSGRDGICYDDTENWLKSNIVGLIDWSLYMRAEGDTRRDSVIKDELYEEHIRGRYNVSAVVDDRRQMIRHWTLKGMPNIIDVGNYNEEF